MQKCSNCGADAPESARFCPNCGVALPTPPPADPGALPGSLPGSLIEGAPPVVPTTPVVSPVTADAGASFSGVGEPPTSGLAIASLISGVLGWVALPCIGAATAVITGHLARKEIDQSQGKKGGAGLAMVGLVLGYAQVALLCLVLTGVSALFAVGGSMKDAFMRAVEEAKSGQTVEEGPPPGDEEQYPDETPEEVPEGDEGDEQGVESPGPGGSSDQPDLPAQGPPGKGGEKAY